VIRHLEPVIGSPPGKPTKAGAREFQRTARRIATEPQAWTPETVLMVQNLFDQMATSWDSEHATSGTGGLTALGHRRGYRQERAVSSIDPCGVVFCSG
jgi:hypothetical protein